MEIIDQINEKIDNYHTSTNYTPLKVVFEVDSPIYLTSPFLHLDSLLGYLCMRDALGELFYCTPSEIVLPIDNLELPVETTDDVNHTSVGIFDSAKLYKQTIYKRFTDKQIHTVNPKKYKKLRVGSGYFKGFMINLPAILCNTITFYCKGDKEELERLLPNLSHLGKKPAVGGGHIKSCSICEVDDDYSFIKDDEIMRPIPVDFAENNLDISLKGGMVIQRRTYKPSYWDKSSACMCYTPNSQISII